MKLNSAYILGFCVGGGLFFISGVLNLFRMTKTNLVIQTALVIAAFVCIAVALFLKKDRCEKTNRAVLHQAFFYGAIILFFGIILVDLIDGFTRIMISDTFQLLCLSAGPAAVFIGIYYYLHTRRNPAGPELVAFVPDALRSQVYINEKLGQGTKKYKRETR